MAKERYKIVKYNCIGRWYFAIMRKKLFGWEYVKGDVIGDICSIATSRNEFIKKYKTEQEAEEVIKNLTYQKTYTITERVANS